MLIGGACHAVCLARSIIMNTCFFVADHLAASPRTPGPGLSEAEDLSPLSDFDTHFEQDFAQRFADNHGAGMQSGTIAEDGFAALEHQLVAAAEVERILNAMALKAVGLSV